MGSSKGQRSFKAQDIRVDADIAAYRVKRIDMDEKQCLSRPKFYACAQQYHLGNGRYGQTTHQREITTEKSVSQK